MLRLRLKDVNGGRRRRGGVRGVRFMQDSSSWDTGMSILTYVLFAGDVSRARELSLHMRGGEGGNKDPMAMPHVRVNISRFLPLSTHTHSAQTNLHAPTYHPFVFADI